MAQQQQQPPLGELGWRGRYSYTSPEVVELREQLQRQAGITGIEIVDPAEPGYAQRAAEIFRRDGYVVLEGLCAPSAIRLALRMLNHHLGRWVGLEPHCQHSRRVE